MWFWLARIIKGRSQVVRTIRGVDSGSRKNVVDIFMFSSVLKLIIVNEIILIRKA